MERKIAVFFILTALLLCAAGCVTDKDFNLPGLVNVKRLGDNQKQIARQLKVQEERFARLKQDIDQHLLEAGLPKQEIISRYGLPIYAKPLYERLHVKEALVYRHPVEYFSRGLIYLYFDQDEKLVTWEALY